MIVFKTILLEKAVPSWKYSGLCHCCPVEKNYDVQLGVSTYQFNMNVFLNYFVQEWIFVVLSIYELWLPSKL